MRERGNRPALQTLKFKIKIFTCCATLCALASVTSTAVSIGPAPEERWKAPCYDPVLYDELEVSSDASARELKKAYYKLSLQHHPDKGGGGERFKRLSEAYQILQDDTLRARYHRRGLNAVHEEGSEEEPQLDPMEVFRAFVGGGQFEHFIGPLSPRLVPDDAAAADDMGFAQARALAAALEARLEPYVAGVIAFFDQAAWEEALRLRGESMGAEILRTVGYVYRNYGHRSLGKLARSALRPKAIRGQWRYVLDRGHQLQTLLAATGSSAKLLLHLQSRRIGDAGAAREPWETEPDPNDDETVELILHTLWKVHRVGIERRIQRACRMVLRDPKVHPEELKLRAEALIRLGRIFTEAGSGADPPHDVLRFLAAGMAGPGPSETDGTVAVTQTVTPTARGAMPAATVPILPPSGGYCATPPWAAGNGDGGW